MSSFPARHALKILDTDPEERFDLPRRRVRDGVVARNRDAGEPGVLLGLGLAEAPAGTAADLWDLVALADAEMIAAKRAEKAGRDGVPA